MSCPEFEDLLREENAAHAVHCRDCRVLLDALTRVDTTFGLAFGLISAPPGLAPAVFERMAHPLPAKSPSPIPEVLDLIGWAAVLTIAAIVVPQFANLLSYLLAGLG